MVRACALTTTDGVDSVTDTESKAASRRGLAGRRMRGPGRVRSLLWSMLGALAAVVFGAGCQAEVDPQAVSVTTLRYGEFELRSGLPTLVATTSRPTCEQGRIFGVDYRIDVAHGEHGVVPVEFRWIHPELAVPSRKLWGRETTALPPGPILERRATSLEGRALWSLEHPDELVSGRYEFQVRRLSDGAVLLSQAFELEGC